ncbi:MAG: 3-phosphoshikimate 1-carboxyvinyltransferase [Thermodesulfovibrio sp.]|uniref:3-phosphoshikimate 1-carboxyvinyltransferase n=2 Tax=Thermodesulfovibrio TaxID=28261 RepID=A0A2J6WHA3_9BACT|nr:MAG: 3-phosphoshikimate 1-carboxyvinyltransferase [Thermodesulfovibrio aggregans]
MEKVIRKAKALKGQITPPADKSISHRAVMFASLAEGASRIKNFLWAKDPLSSLNAMRLLGVDIQITETKEIIVNATGLHSLKEPDNVIDCGNSGTTIRLLSGILAGQPFLSILTGDESLRQRPMRRIIEPLNLMGAHILGRDSNKFPPLVIKGGCLKGINYNMPIASAQVKSAILLAALFAEGETSVTEPHKSRDHTEKMLKSMGVKLEINNNTIKITPPKYPLNPFDITIPNDFSSAAFFIAGACLVADSEVVIKNVCLNETRTGFLEVLKLMGAKIEIFNLKQQAGEPVGDILVKTASALKAVTVQGEIIPKLIDEFPILCVVATQAEGTTVIRDAKDLRAKESDRIRAMTIELSKMGADIKELDDGVEITGPCKLMGAQVYSYKDHRIAMALSIAALIAEGETVIKDADCVDISFPEFYHLLETLQR